MDNNSTDGTDKRSWRDRLGIGTKELPKLSDDFKSTPKETSVKPAVRPAVSAPSVPPPGAAKPAPRAAPAVVKPAPMAPRSAPKIEARVVPKLEVRAAEPANNAAFAERLKSQREAAEKLAEQRVLAARQKAEMAAAQRSGQSGSPTANSQSTVIVAKDAPEAGRPKFVFADEDSGKVVPTELPPLPKRSAATVSSSIVPPKPMAGPLPPPRPPLGVDRPVLPPRPAVPMQADMPPPFRPLEGVSGSYAPPPPVFPQRQYTVPPAPTRSPAPTRPPFVGSSLPPPQEFGGSELNGGGHSFTPETRYSPEPPPLRPQRPQLRGPMSGPGGLPPGSYTDDIFEQAPQRPQRRVTAGDYQSAYRETDSFEYEQPKSNGPWILLVLLALVAALAGAGMWFLNTQWQNQAAMTGAVPSAQTSQTTPVVQPPADPPKVEPEAPPNSQAAAVTDTNAASQSVVPPSSKKQIYDRIVGDREVLGGQLTPTEEPPVAPEMQIEEAVEPISGEGQAPAQQGTSGETITDDAEPLPLPPPPGQTNDQQGSLNAPAGQPGETTISPTASSGQVTELPVTTTQVADESRALAQASEQVSEQVSASTAEIEPPPAAPPATAPLATQPDASTALTPAETDQAALASDAAETITDEPVLEQEPVAAAPAVKPKPASTKVVKLAPQKKLRKQVPSETVSNSAATQTPIVETLDTSGDSNVLYGDASTAVPAPEQTKKKRTLFDLLDNNASPQPQSSEEQVATLQPAPKRAVVQPQQQQRETAPAPTGGNGFVAQLASFRTQSEATQEFARMKTKHPGILDAMAPVVREVTVAGSKRYQLAVGPMGSRESASRLCSRLIQAGERDCLAKRQ